MHQFNLSKGFINWDCGIYLIGWNEKQVKRNCTFLDEKITTDFVLIISSPDNHYTISPYLPMQLAILLSLQMVFAFRCAKLTKKVGLSKMASISIPRVTYLECYLATTDKQLPRENKPEVTSKRHTSKKDYFQATKSTKEIEMIHFFKELGASIASTIIPKKMTSPKDKVSLQSGIKAVLLSGKSRYFWDTFTVFKQLKLFMKDSGIPFINQVELVGMVALEVISLIPQQEDLSDKTFGRMEQLAILEVIKCGRWSINSDHYVDVLVGVKRSSSKNRLASLLISLSGSSDVLYFIGKHFGLLKNSDASTEALKAEMQDLIEAVEEGKEWSRRLSSL